MANIYKQKKIFPFLEDFSSMFELTTELNRVFSIYETTTGQVSSVIMGEYLLYRQVQENKKKKSSYNLDIK